MVSPQPSWATTCILPVALSPPSWTASAGVHSQRADQLSLALSAYTPTKSGKFPETGRLPTTLSGRVAHILLCPVPVPERTICTLNYL